MRSNRCLKRPTFDVGGGAKLGSGYSSSVTSKAPKRLDVETAFRLSTAATRVATSQTREMVEGAEETERIDSESAAADPAVATPVDPAADSMALTLACSLGQSLAGCPYSRQCQHWPLKPLPLPPGVDPLPFPLPLGVLERPLGCPLEYGEGPGISPFPPPLFEYPWLKPLDPDFPFPLGWEGQSRAKWP